MKANNTKASEPLMYPYIIFQTSSSDIVKANNTKGSEVLMYLTDTLAVAYPNGILP